MAQPAADSGQKSRWGTWIALATVAIVAGLWLPQMLPTEPVTTTKAEKAEVKDKAKIEYTAPALPDAPQFQGMLLRLGFGTVIVLGLLAATLWGMRRWMNPLANADSPDREMRLKETLNLGNRCCLHLVHLGKREVLIGVDGTGIKAVVQLPDGFEEVLAEAVTPPLPEVGRTTTRLAA